MSTTYTRRQVVIVGSPMGSRLDRGVIVGAHPHKPGFVDWYVVQFDGASCMSVHATNMQPVNDRPFKGPLPTYRSTQS